MNVTGVLLSVIAGFVPMFIFAALVYWIDRYEKEPLLLLGGVFIWGAVVAAGGSFIINTIFGIGIYIFTGSQTATVLTTSTFIAPIIEESLKGFAVLIIFLLFRKEFNSILDGIVYASVAALGFAATENVYYIYTYGFAENGLSGLLWMVFVRVVLVGWQHPFYTSFTGIGLATARLTRYNLVKVIAPLVGWFMAVFMHALHNAILSVVSGAGGFLITLIVDWSGWFLMFLFILWALYREQRWIVNQLREEVTLGVISPLQYRTACSSWAQAWVRFNSLLDGSFSVTNRFYQLTGELAYKKQQRSTLGEEGSNSETIQKLRTEINRLAQRAQA